MISVVQTNADELLRTGDWWVETDIRSLKKKCLDSARRSPQVLKLFLEERESILDLKRFLNPERHSWKLQEVIADGFCNVKAGVAENAPEPNHVGRVSSRKVHEFHGYLL